MTKLNSCLREASSHQNVGNSIDFPNSQNSWPKFQFMKPWFSKNSSNLVEPGFLNKETNIYSPANIRVLRRAIPTSPTSFTSTPHLDFSTQGESGKIWGRKTLSLGYSFFQVLADFGWNVSGSLSGSQCETECSLRQCVDGGAVNTRSELQSTTVPQNAYFSYRATVPRIRISKLTMGANLKAPMAPLSSVNWNLGLKLVWILTTRQPSAESNKHQYGQIRATFYDATATERANHYT